MESKEQTLLRFLGVDIFRVNFYSLERYNNTKDINVKVDAKVYYPKDKTNAFDIIMFVELNSQEIFYLSIDAIGHFELKTDKGDEIDAKQRKSFVNVNAPAIMFPYIRAFITTFTSNLGDVVGSLTLPARFFRGELEEFIPEETSGELNKDIAAPKDK